MPRERRGGLIVPSRHPAQKSPTESVQHVWRLPALIHAEVARAIRRTPESICGASRTEHSASVLKKQFAASDWETYTQSEVRDSGRRARPMDAGDPPRWGWT
jgi:hypothetical protein